MSGVEPDVVQLRDHVAWLKAGNGGRSFDVDCRQLTSLRESAQCRDLRTEVRAGRAERRNQQLPGRKDLLHVVLDVSDVETETARPDGRLRLHGETDHLAPDVENRTADRPSGDGRAGLDGVAYLHRA